MPYEFTAKGQHVLAEVKSFMDDFIYPAEAVYQREYEEGGHHSIRR